MLHLPRLGPSCSVTRTCAFSIYGRSMKRYVSSSLAQSIEGVNGKLHWPQEIKTTKVLPVLFGWTLSNQKCMGKYAAVYNELGLAAACLPPTVPHVWFRRQGVRHSAEVFSVISNNVAQDTKIILHCFSGAPGVAFPFISTDLPQNLSIVAAIFDSGPVEFTRPAILAAGKCGLDQRAINHLYYYAFCGLGSAVEFVFGRRKRLLETEARVSSVFEVPQLYLYSEVDPVALPGNVETIMDEQAKLGRSVEQCRWKDSEHVMHLLKYPEEYRAAVFSFLSKYNVIDR